MVRMGRQQLARAEGQHGIVADATDRVMGSLMEVWAPNTDEVDEAIHDGTFERLVVDMVLLGTDAAGEFVVLDTESRVESEQSITADQSQRPLEALKKQKENFC